MWPLRLAALLAVCIYGASGAPVDDIIEFVPLAEAENYRLPETIMPIAYNIKLRPYLLESDGEKQFKFDGEVQIEIKPTENVSEIKLHAKNLTINTQEYWKKGETTRTKINLSTPNEVTDIMTLNVNVPLQANTTYVLHFNYTGILGDDMRGFYRSSYTTKKNETKWLASTQFQTFHARKAFPSFDEPRFKAKFNVTLIHHKSMKTYSNTRVKTSSRDGNYTTTVYEQTPKMSTYILAFIVSEFTERTNGDFGVIGRPEYYDQTEYSFEVGQKILEELDTYFDLPYYSLENDKMHMAAIPDFAPGAMENWGLLTYRERALLYDERSTSLRAKQSIATIIAHEQAHMWFGDLVTCEWWSYAWLNEGFASYFEYFATANVEKDFQLDQQFTVNQIQSVMGMDSTNNTNPMSDKNTNTHAEISRMFNSITYNKGGSVIRMVRHVMGEEPFRKSLQDYLKKNKYQNTEPKDLFVHWKTNWPTAWKNFSDPLFESFTEQVGYPVVHIEVANDSQSFQISQKRFLLNKNDKDSNPDLLYTIPITFTDSEKKDFHTTTPDLFLPSTTEKHKVDLKFNVSWVIANIQQTGYYRVNYDERNWHGLHHALLAANWSHIHEQNRAQLVDDLFNLARSETIEYNLALAVLEYLETETHYLPWSSAFNGFNFLQIRLGADTKAFGHYIRQLTQKAYNMLGFEERTSDTTLDIYNRANILDWSCKYGNGDCTTKARNYFNTHLIDGVPVNIRSVVYCSTLREGDSKNFDTLFNKYKRETVATEQTLILNSLGCVKDQQLIEHYFDIILSNDVRRQDKSAALTSLYTNNNENVTPVFNLVTANFEKLAQATDYSTVASAISGIASRFTEESQETKLKTFNKDNKEKFGSSAVTLENAEKTVSDNLNWAKKNLVPFREYLDKRGNSGVSINSFSLLTLILTVVLARLFR